MHDELLQLSGELLALAGGKAGADQEVTLRRSVSTAYYSLFHLLIYEAASRLVTGTGNPVVTPRRRREVARAFSHTQVRKLCVVFSGHPGPSPAADVNRTLAGVGQVVVSLLKSRFFSTMSDQPSVGTRVLFKVFRGGGRPWIALA